jgi:hypothetical protein
MEIEDATIKQVVNKALRELERYWDETTLITVPFASCIDLEGFNSSSIVKVYRTSGLGGAEGGTGMIDPAYAQQWMIFSNAGTMYNIQDYALNYAAWSTLNQVKNTISTDMAFKIIFNERFEFDNSEGIFLNVLFPLFFIFFSSFNKLFFELNVGNFGITLRLLLLFLKRLCFNGNVLIIESLFELYLGSIFLIISIINIYIYIQTLSNIFKINNLK